MPAFPIQATVGDPIFRSQNSSVTAIRRFARIAADSTLKLNNQERIVNPGDDALSFSTSRRIRADLSTLKTVQETGQLHTTGLGLAVDALEGIKTQLDGVKRMIVQSQVADPSERDSIQAEIDLALSQIDSAAHNTKLGSRSLLDGSSTIQAYQSIAAGTGVVTDFAFNQGQSLTQTAGVKNVRVNKIGLGGPTKVSADGRSILSFRSSVVGAASKARLTLGAGGNASFAEFRVTGKLGSATLRINSNMSTLNGFQLEGTAAAFNKLAQETGVTLVSDPTNTVYLTTTGFGSDEFIKVELISFASGATNPASFGNVGGAGAWIGDTQTAFGQAATVRVNGRDVDLSGSNGTTARYLENGFDVELDYSTLNLTNAAAVTAGITTTVNIDLTDGIVGLLGPTGDSRDSIHYGYGNFTTENLGRANGQYTVTTASGGALMIPGSALRYGQDIVGGRSIADIGSGGSLALPTGNVQEAIATIDRAVKQTIAEQTRLGVLQSNFVDSIQRAEVSLGNLTSADADIIGVDAAAEITNLVHAQLGAQTATGLLSQANSLQATVFQLLRA